MGGVARGLFQLLEESLEFHRHRYRAPVAPFGGLHLAGTQVLSLHGQGQLGKLSTSTASSKVLCGWRTHTKLSGTRRKVTPSRHL